MTVQIFNSTINSWMLFPVTMTGHHQWPLRGPSWSTKYFLILCIWSFSRFWTWHDVTYFLYRAGYIWFQLYIFWFLITQTGLRAIWWEAVFGIVIPGMFWATWRPLEAVLAWFEDMGNILSFGVDICLVFGSHSAYIRSESIERSGTFVHPFLLLCLWHDWQKLILRCKRRPIYAVHSQFMSHLEMADNKIIHANLIKELPSAQG